MCGYGSWNCYAEEQTNRRGSTSEFPPSVASTRLIIPQSNRESPSSKPNWFVSNKKQKWPRMVRTRKPVKSRLEKLRRRLKLTSWLLIDWRMLLRRWGRNRTRENLRVRGMRIQRQIADGTFCFRLTFIILWAVVLIPWFFLSAQDHKCRQTLLVTPGDQISSSHRITSNRDANRLRESTRYWRRHSNAQYLTR